MLCKAFIVKSQFLFCSLKQRFIVSGTTEILFKKLCVIDGYIQINFTFL